MPEFQLGESVRYLNENATAFNCVGTVVEIQRQSVSRDQDVATLTVQLTIGNDSNPAGTVTSWFSEDVEKLT